jgi:hypothetical protein
MGVWPPGAGLQGQAPNHPMLLRLRVVVVSDGEKAAMSRQVCVDASLPRSGWEDEQQRIAADATATRKPEGLRKVFQKLSKRVQVGGTRISVDGTCLRSTRQPVYRFAQAFGYRRHEHNRFAEDWRLHRASIRNVGTWRGVP